MSHFVCWHCRPEDFKLESPSTHLMSPVCPASDFSLFRTKPCSSLWLSTLKKHLLQLEINFNGQFIITHLRLNGKRHNIAHCNKPIALLHALYPSQFVTLFDSNNQQHLFNVNYKQTWNLLLYSSLLSQFVIKMSKLIHFLLLWQNWIWKWSGRYGSFKGFQNDLFSLHLNLLVLFRISSFHVLTAGSLRAKESCFTEPGTDCHFNASWNFLCFHAICHGMLCQPGHLNQDKFRTGHIL